MATGWQVRGDSVTRGGGLVRILRARFPAARERKSGIPEGGRSKRALGWTVAAASGPPSAEAAVFRRSLGRPIQLVTAAWKKMSGSPCWRTTRTFRARARVQYPAAGRRRPSALGRWLRVHARRARGGSGADASTARRPPPRSRRAAARVQLGAGPGPSGKNGTSKWRLGRGGRRGKARG